MQSDALQRSYVTHCKMNGIIDKEEVIKEEVKRVKKKYGWKNIDFYIGMTGSEFAELIMDRLGLFGSGEYQDSKYLSKNGI